MANNEDWDNEITRDPGKTFILKRDTFKFDHRPKQNYLNHVRTIYGRYTAQESRSFLAANKITEQNFNSWQQQSLSLACERAKMAVLEKKARLAKRYGK